MEIFEKKVSMTELFFDLIFVWATARMTHMLHHLHNGLIDPMEYFKYLTTFISWINIWMIQTLLNNRYNNDDIIDQFFIYFNMFILLVLVNFVSTDFQKEFIVYNRLTVIIIISQIFQYYRQYKKINDKENKILIKNFLLYLLLEVIIIGTGGLLPYNIGVILVVIGIFFTCFFPLFFMDRMKKVPVNFPNLVERLTLIVIITFGETMISIISYFKVHSYLNTFICFSMVTTLFFYYKVVFNNIIEHHNTNSTGMLLMYSHYLILIGISGVTISINSLLDLQVNNKFVVLFLYISFAIFYLGVLLNYKYNKTTHRYSRNCILIHFLILFFSLFISFIFRNSQLIVLGVSALMNIFIAINIWKFSNKCIKDEKRNSK